MAEGIAAASSMVGDANQEGEKGMSVQLTFSLPPFDSVQDQSP